MDSPSLYLEISQKILCSINSGEYPENTPLPSERFLSEKYHVSRTTIRQAIDHLKEDNAIYSVPGHGNFIKPKVYTQPLKKFYSFTDTLKSSDVLIENEIVCYELVQADQSIAKKTGHPKGADFHKLCRLRSAKEYPLMLETTYLPKGRFTKLDLDVLAKGSLYKFLRSQYGFRVDQVEETLRPVMPRPEEKALLKIPSNTPCILLERFSYEDDILIEYTKSIVRGDKYIFHVDLDTSVGRGSRR